MFLNETVPSATFHSDGRQRQRPTFVARVIALGLALTLVGLPSQRAQAEEPAPAAPATPAVPETTPPAPASPVAPEGSTAPVEAPIPSATTPPPAVEPPPTEVAPTPGTTLTSPSALPKTEIVYRRPRTGLLVAGLVLFVTGWVTDIGFTYGYNHQPATTSLIPIAGPFIQMTEQYGLDGPPVNTGSTDADARVNKNLDTANSTIRGLALTGAAICGVMQLAGLALTIAGIATKRKTTRYAHAGAAGKPATAVVPSASGLVVQF